MVLLISLKRYVHNGHVYKLNASTQFRASTEICFKVSLSNRCSWLEIGFIAEAKFIHDLIVLKPDSLI